MAPAPDHVAVDYECLMPGIAVCSVVFKFQMWKVRATAAHRARNTAFMATGCGDHG